MYKVEAVIRPRRLATVAEKLKALGMSDFTVTKVQGHDPCGARVACYRGVAYTLPYKDFVRVELAVANSALDVTLERIVAGAFTHEPGEGKIFVSLLSEVIDIGPENAGPYGTARRVFSLMDRAASVIAH